MFAPAIENLANGFKMIFGGLLHLVEGVVCGVIIFVLLFLTLLMWPFMRGGSNGEEEE